MPSHVCVCACVHEYMNLRFYYICSHMYTGTRVRESYTHWMLCTETTTWSNAATWWCPALMATSRAVFWSYVPRMDAKWVQNQYRRCTYYGSHSNSNFCTFEDPSTCKILHSGYKSEKMNQNSNQWTAQPNHNKQQLKYFAPYFGAKRLHSCPPKVPQYRGDYWRLLHEGLCSRTACKWGVTREFADVTCFDLLLSKLKHTILCLLSVVFKITKKGNG